LLIVIGNVVEVKNKTRLSKQFSKQDRQWQQAMSSGTATPSLAMISY